MKLLYPVIDGHKECGDCHIVKELSLFKIRTKPNKDGSFSPETICKECARLRSSKYARARGVKPSKRYPIIDDHKRCTTCNENKHISEYDFKPSGKMFAKCKPCLKKYRYEAIPRDERIQYSKNWHANNKEKSIDQRKKYNRFQVDNLTDIYIKGVLTRFGGLHSNDIPQELIDMKRKQLLLLREIRKSKSL